MALNFNTLMTMAIENRSKTINDALSKSNALLFMLRKLKAVKTFDGGLAITENIMYNGTGNVQSYQGLDLLNANQSDHLTMAKWSMAQYSNAVIMSGQEAAMTDGESAQLKGLLKSRLQAAEVELFNRIARDLYADGTGANNLTGIQAMLSLTPTTGVYGGIDRASNAFWQHKAATGTAITASNIQSKFNNMINSLTIGNDKVDVIMACQAHYELLESAMQAQQRYEAVGESTDVNGGFTSLMYKGARVFFENNTNGPSGMPADQSYFLNLKTVKLRPYNSDKLQMFGTDPSDRDAVIKRLKWYGNLTCSNLQRNGVVQG